ncbi:hypothetical protein [Streptomyces sp. 5-10]|uniref:hypothetical protein n=1 Tax=Streptomyces sp. 5-10 TaxID=878925 RepID=UPI00168B564D|nr:hypothetical protein [Streptomyces sp. 5-10]MBD3004741.1 hypothetical protein [Streptomyces sp. 5-10]
MAIQKSALVGLESATFMLEDWCLSELGNPRNYATCMQLSGWLPEGNGMRSPLVSAIAGNQHLREADLEGKYAHFKIYDVDVEVTVKGVGADRLFVKISWAHHDDDTEGPEDGILQADEVKR